MGLKQVFHGGSIWLDQDFRWIEMAFLWKYKARRLTLIVKNEGGNMYTNLHLLIFFPSS